MEFCAEKPEHLHRAVWILENVEAEVIDTGIQLARRFSFSELNQFFIFLDCVRVSHDPAGRYERLLTAREKKILFYISRGFSSKRIAEKLNVKLYTVNKHRENIRRKLGVTSSAELVISGLRLFQSDKPFLKFDRTMSALERNIVQRLSRGRSSAEIATSLDLSRDDLQHLCEEIDVKIGLTGFTDFLRSYMARAAPE